MSPVKQKSKAGRHLPLDGRSGAKASIGSIGGAGVQLRRRCVTFTLECEEHQICV